MSVIDVFAAMRQSALVAAPAAVRCTPCSEVMQLLYVHSTYDRKEHTSLLHLYGVTSQRKNVTAVVAGFLPCIYVRPAMGTPLAATPSPPLVDLVSRLNLRLRPPSLSSSSSSKDWRIARGIVRAGVNWAASCIARFFLVVHAFVNVFASHQSLQVGAKKLLCLSQTTALHPENTLVLHPRAYVSQCTTMTRCARLLTCSGHATRTSLIWTTAACGRTAVAALSNFAPSLARNR